MYHAPVSPIGAVFTPLAWGEWAVQEFGVTEKWLAGKSVLDPTCGEGHLLEALIRSALAKGIPKEQLPLERLFGIEREVFFLERFKSRMQETYAIVFPENNLRCCDVLLDPVDLRCDILLGNPPWCNFTELPAKLKPLLKPLFLRYGLVKRSADTLLGNSRIDIAALVLAKTISEQLSAQGEALFFAPLSLLLGDGAHANFRRFRVNEVPFGVDTVYDFADELIFNQVLTRYGLLHLRRDQEQTYPVRYYVRHAQHWQEKQAAPFQSPEDAWLVQDEISERFASIPISKTSAPRQGINTGGANDVFIFQACVVNNDGTVTVTNTHGETILLPAQFVHPLLIAEDFRKPGKAPQRFVLLPYTPKGILLTAAALEEHPLLYNYLLHHRTRLEARKGTMLRSKMNRDGWWTLFGVGAYNFAKYKIVWEAYGRSTFRPMLVDGRWQANQSLQAFIPFSNKRDAQRTLRALQHKQVENYLLAQRMPGTMNWAQPGRMKKLFRLS